MVQRFSQNLPAGNQALILETPRDISYRNNNMMARLEGSTLSCLGLLNDKGDKKVYLNLCKEKKKDDVGRKLKRNQFAGMLEVSVKSEEISPRIKEKQSEVWAQGWLVTWSQGLEWGWTFSPETWICCSKKRAQPLQETHQRMVWVL